MLSRSSGRNRTTSRFPEMAKVSETTKAKSGAVDRENGPIDPDLASVIDAWHTLPPDTRTAILAIVAAAQGR